MGHIKREIITALSVLASALLVIFYLIPNYIELEEEFELASLSPAFFPLIAAWIIAGLAGLYLISILIRKKRGVDIDMDHEWLSAGKELNAYKSALVVIAYVFIIKYVGFIIWEHILAIVVGSSLGLVVGVIPGLTATMAVTLILPMTFDMEFVTSIMLLVGAYKGGIFGGSITAILLNTPGTPASAATVLDGYALTKQGKGVKALKMAKYASTFG